MGTETIEYHVSLRDNAGHEHQETIPFPMPYTYSPPDASRLYLLPFSRLTWTHYSILANQSLSRAPLNFCLTNN